MEIITRVAVACLIASTAIAQPEGPQFEVADVRIVGPHPINREEVQAAIRSTNTVQNIVDGLPESSGLIRLRGVRMKTLIEIAYKEIFDPVWAANEESEYLKGLPSWSPLTLYDLIAKAPAHTSADDLRLMIQGVLKERLHLTVHQEERTMSVYALVVGKNGSKLLPAESSGDPMCRSERGDPVRTEVEGTTDFSRLCRNITMGALALQVAHLLRKDVVDRTGLSGEYDLRLDSKMLCEYADNHCSSAESVPGGLAKLGLAIETRKEPRPIIVIDHVDRVPADN
jgi:uncharacterized protein (TIGR03435 family)